MINESYVNAILVSGAELCGEYEAKNDVVFETNEELVDFINACYAKYLLKKDEDCYWTELVYEELEKYFKGEHE